MGETETRVALDLGDGGETETRFLLLFSVVGEIEGPKNAISAPRRDEIGGFSLFFHSRSGFFQSRARPRRGSCFIFCRGRDRDEGLHLSW